MGPAGDEDVWQLGTNSGAVAERVRRRGTLSLVLSELLMAMLSGATAGTDDACGGWWGRLCSSDRWMLPWRAGEDGGVETVDGLRVEVMDEARDTEAAVVQCEAVAVLVVVVVVSVGSAAEPAGCDFGAFRDVGGLAGAAAGGATANGASVSIGDRLSSLRGPRRVLRCTACHSAGVPCAAWLSLPSEEGRGDAGFELAGAGSARSTCCRDFAAGASVFA